ncbi:hypothetical protein H0A36_13680 [Endozoicomonas sp. SM1973]|uniref:N-acetyltransferase domain-containing protein n=1 Tax=Spartinivicinus marinus TaxID=2994442 RepID=A0A853ID07_9GAMM|nr:hypothetical protein [Spartinivicinus marinus]MCX4027071.1 hypothetical protein [Spartinivicinus marinus]NYZ67065.1 hypothetical protein [Spartinivicinus marinus]
MLGKQTIEKNLELVFSNHLPSSVHQHKVRIVSGVKLLPSTIALYKLYSTWPIYLREHWPNTQKEILPLLQHLRYQFLIKLNGNAVGYYATLPLYTDLSQNVLSNYGYSWALQASLERNVKQANTLCAIAAVLSPNFKGIGLSRVLVELLKNTAISFNYKRLIVPVRPTLKSSFPHEDMQTYINRQRDDGQAFDPWIRAHQTGGGIMRNICHHSICVITKKSRWENWLRHSLNEGDNIIPGGLAPLNISSSTQLGSYIEPNIWFDYSLSHY